MKMRKVDRVRFSYQMESFLEVILAKISLMEREFISVLMEISLKVIGSWA